ncbi:RES family NAD+ phosphorylase [Undibacterium sp.]|uniref:RES family NAD+ phosphorylase n=1 Tax=Undibacterium sp. TaxID=1914977 RepID=UPI002731E328|nr:RES family NAD+ phosphorylase [Undibacterium sp.]MDP1978711.1 RES family NAD+ phosphorylase [Undibacterium sp.]
MQISEKSGCTDKLESSVTRGSTGRTTNFLSKEHHAEEREVLEWLESPDLGSLLVHSAVATFENLIRSTEVIAEPTFTAYRGRHFSNHQHPSPTFDEFGPPPADKAPAGRYNPQGSPVLYLATTRKGVAAEFANDETADRVLYCLDYVVITAGLKIANFACAGLSNFVQIAFDYAEHADESIATDKRNYLFSQTLAHIVAKAGFSAMLVPGIRGSPENRYSNLVIFSPGDLWLSWCCTDRPPTTIG